MSASSALSEFTDWTSRGKPQANCFCIFCCGEILTYPHVSSLIAAAMSGSRPSKSVCRAPALPASSPFVLLFWLVLELGTYLIFLLGLREKGTPAAGSTAEPSASHETWHSPREGWVKNLMHCRWLSSRASLLSV